MIIATSANLRLSFILVTKICITYVLKNLQQVYQTLPFVTIVRILFRFNIVWGVIVVHVQILLHHYDK